MANFGGIGGLMDGVMQGYTFAKDAKRKQADDDYKQKERGQTEKVWGREDARQADIAALNNEFFPAEAKTTPAPAIGLQAPSAQTDLSMAADSDSQPATSDQPSAPVASAPTPAAPAAPKASTMPSAPVRPVPASPADDTAAYEAAYNAPTPAASTPAAGAATTSATEAAVAPQAKWLPQPTPPASTPQSDGLPQQAPAAQTADASQPKGMPVQPNQMTSMNKSLDYLIRRAQIDAQHGDTDGKALINLYKMQETNKQEGLTDAIKMLHSGDEEGAMRRYNTTGDSKDWHVQSSVDGVFKSGGVDLPTKIVTVQNVDGTIRTINTAQAMIQNQAIDKMLSQGQKAEEMSEKREDNAGNRKIRQQQADTQEGYRSDQGDHMRRQDDANSNVRAPVWDKDADKLVVDAYTVKDPVSGDSSMDAPGLQFAKQVAVKMSQSNGGDTVSAIGFAVQKDNQLKAQAKGDLVKLGELRQQALSALRPAPTQEQSTTNSAPNSAEWNARNSASRAAAPSREDGRRAILQQELASEKDPQNIAALKREVSRLGPVDSTAPATTAAPVVKVSAPAPSRISAPAGGLPKPKPADGSVYIGDDPVLTSLKKSLAGIDASDPRNVQQMMALGQAKNDRMVALQDKYGRLTPLTETQ